MCTDFWPKHDYFVITINTTSVKIDQDGQLILEAGQAYAYDIYLHLELIEVFRSVKILYNKSCVTYLFWQIKASKAIWKKKPARIHLWQRGSPDAFVPLGRLGETTRTRCLQWPWLSLYIERSPIQLNSAQLNSWFLLN